MEAETNKAAMRRFVEFINTGSEKLAEELISPDAVFHVPGRAEPMGGPAGYLAVIGMMRGGFPDIQWTLEEMIAEDDKLAARFTTRGTHRDTFFGIPPTGKTIAVQAMNFYRLSGGQFIEGTRSTRFARVASADWSSADTGGESSWMNGNRN